MVILGDRLFTSGLSSDRSGGLESETHRVFQMALGMLHDAGVSPRDVARTRVWYVDEGGEDITRDAHGVVFDHPGPAFSAIRITCLPENAAVMIELEAVKGAASRIEHYEPVEIDATSSATFVDGEMWLSGQTAGGEASAAQVESILKNSTLALSQFGLTAADTVATRHFMRHDTQFEERPREWLEFMGAGIPTSAGIAVDNVGTPGRKFMLELEAFAGAAEGRHNVRSGRTFEIEHNYCRSVRVNGRGVIYVAGTTSVVPGETVRHPGEVRGQVKDTLETIRWAIEEQGAAWNDLARTRTYVVGGPEKLVEAAEALSEELSGVEAASALIGVPVLGRPEIVIEIEATAVSA